MIQATSICTTQNSIIKLILVIITISLLTTSCKKKKEDDVVPNIGTNPTLSFVNASDPNIQYSGRIDFTDRLAPEFWYSGVSIKAKFQGPVIEIVLQDYGTGDEQHTNYYNIFIDQKLYKVLAVTNYQSTYRIASNLSILPHTIEIVRRTEAQIGRSVFYGFKVLTTTNLLPVENKPTRKIEFIGDSYTCGYGNEVSIPGPPDGNPAVGFHSINENNYNAWGAITARDLHAEYHCTAYSGRGMYRNNTGSTNGTLPLLYKRTNPDDEHSNWETNLYVPDVVVIHLGTNDFLPEKSASPNMVDSTSFVNTYIGFIGTLRTYYPSAKIICVVPNSQTDAFPAGFKSLTRITNYIHAVTDYFSGSDNNVFFFALPTQRSPYGEDWHPSAATHESMAKNIEPFIKSKMGW